MAVSVFIAPVGLQQFFDSNGNPLAGGKLFTYAAGTTNPLTTYTDATGTVQNPNPIILNSAGFASPGIWLTTAAYKFQLQNSSNVVQWTVDNILSGFNQKVPSSQIFTGSGTFTIPQGITALKLTVTGGGGAGGGGTAAANTSGSGGGSGGTAIKWLSGLTPGNTLTVVVGGGGAGASGAPGNAGVASAVSSGTQVIATVTGNPGGGGGTGTALGGSGGTATGGDLNLSGNSGTFELVTASNGTGQLGAPSFWGGGGTGGASGVNPGSAGGAPGAGGGGGGGGGGNTLGGAGAIGLVLFEWVA